MDGAARAGGEGARTVAVTQTQGLALGSRDGGGPGEGIIMPRCVRSTGNCIPTRTSAHTTVRSQPHSQEPPLPATVNHTATWVTTEHERAHAEASQRACVR